MTTVRVVFDDMKWKHIATLFIQDNVGVWLRTVKLENLQSEVNLIKNSFRVSCVTDIRVMLSSGSFFT